MLLLASMAGNYPRSYSQPECNACGCYNGADAISQATAAAAASYVAANTPPSVRMMFLGFSDGDNVRTGDVMETCAAIQVGVKVGLGLGLGRTVYAQTLSWHTNFNPSSEPNHAPTDPGARRRPTHAATP